MVLGCTYTTKGVHTLHLATLIMIAWIPTIGSLWFYHWLLWHWRLTLLYEFHLHRLSTFRFAWEGTYTTLFWSKLNMHLQKSFSQNISHSNIHETLPLYFKATLRNELKCKYVPCMQKILCGVWLKHKVIIFTKIRNNRPILWNCEYNKTKKWFVIKFCFK